MAEVIRFPSNHRDSRSLDGTPRERCTLALEFVLNSIRSGEVDPTKMFLMYGTCDGSPCEGGETIWSYLNLGFDPDTLTKAVCRVLDDVEENNGRDSWD